MDPSRPNPTGGWGLRAISLSFVVNDAIASPPPLSSTSPRKTHPQNGVNFRDWTLAMQGLFIAQQGTASAPNSLVGLLPIALIIFIFYFVMYRPVRQKQRAVELMISKLTKGDRVITSGGIYGTVVQDKGQTLMLKVADNVKLEVSKSAVVALQSAGSGPAKN